MASWVFKILSKKLSRNKLLFRATEGSEEERLLGRSPKHPEPRVLRGEGRRYIIPRGAINSLMAKRKNRKGFVAIPFSIQLALGTLANETVLMSSILSSLAEDLYVISIDVWTAIRALTAGEGPIFCGICHGDYSVTEVKECLEANVVNPDDKIAVEHSRRQVRKYGVFHGLNTEEVLNDGKSQRVKVRFTVGSGQNFSFWAYNNSGAALTTGAQVEIMGTIYGKWLR